MTTRILWPNGGRIDGVPLYFVCSRYKSWIFRPGKPMPVSGVAVQISRTMAVSIKGAVSRQSSLFCSLSNDPGKVDGNFFCYVATVLFLHRNVLIFTQRMHKPT